MTNKQFIMNADADTPTVLAEMAPKTTTTTPADDSSPYLEDAAAALTASVEPSFADALASPEAAAWLAQQRGAEKAADILRALPAVAQLIESQETTVRDLAVSNVGTQPEGAAYLALGPQLKAAFDRFAATRDQANAHPGLNRLGKQQHAQAARVAMADTLTATLDRAVEHITTALSAKFPEKGWPAPDAPVVAEAELEVSLFKDSEPAEFLARAFDTLRRAADPATSNEEKSYLNQLLRKAFRPLVYRRETAPEGFARDLAPVAGQLRVLIDRHLNAVSVDNGKARLARTIAEKMKTDYAFARHHALTSETWDDYILKVGAPLLFGRGE